MGSGEEEDDGGLTPTEDDNAVQCPSGPPESVFALVNQGYSKKKEFDERRACYGYLCSY